MAVLSLKGLMIASRARESCVFSSSLAAMTRVYCSPFYTGRAVIETIDRRPHNQISVQLNSNFPVIANGAICRIYW
jgi:hypothetical protein